MSDEEVCSVIQTPASPYPRELSLNRCIHQLIFQTPWEVGRQAGLAISDVSLFYKLHKPSLAEKVPVSALSPVLLMCLVC